MSAFSGSLAFPQLRMFTGFVEGVKGNILPSWLGFASSWLGYASSWLGFSTSEFDYPQYL